ncbi:MAG: TonB-dependent receptor, partial [Ignavibacteria bacterium]|nr:TonB-dependent receptor [Ignavibacteria bacterium]
MYSGYSSNNKNYFGSIHLNYGYDLFSLHLRGLKRTSKNFRDPLKEIPNSDLDNKEFEFGFSLHPSWGISGISYSNYKTNYGIPLTEEDDEPIAIEMEKKQIKLLTEFYNLSSLFNTMNFKLSYQNYHHREYLRDNPSSSHGSEFSLNTLNADLGITHKPLFEGNEGSLGFWLLHQKYNVEGEEALTPNANSQNFAFYLLEKFNLNKLGLILGGRIDKNLIKIPSAIVSDSMMLGEDKNFLSFSGSIGFTYQINNSISSSLNVANAFRSPAIEELASFAIHEATQSFDIGNRKLKNENNLGLDFGIKLEDEKYKVELGTYYNSIKNYIYRNPTNLFY